MPESRPCPGVAEDVASSPLGGGGIQRNDHRAQAEQRQQQHRHLEPVGRQERDPVAWLQAEALRQPHGDRAPRRESSSP